MASNIANGVEEAYNIELEFLRPGLLLVILGQFSFITTITSLVITARLKKFDDSLEEAAYNLGGSRWYVLRTITLPFLRPAMIAAGIVAFLVSFENFNTTLFLVGSDAPLTITMYRSHGQGRLHTGTQCRVGVPDAGVRGIGACLVAGAARQIQIASSPITGG